jgi:hypothetical protein
VLKNIQSILTTLALLLAAPVLTHAQGSQRIPVSSDPGAHYTLLELKRSDARFVHVTTRRDGPSGTSYAKREVDCGTMRARYLGDGDTLEEMRHSQPAPMLAILVTGSISHAISAFACSQVK